MSFVRAARHLRTFLLGLFVFAQIAAVMPTMCEHVLDVYGANSVATHSVAAHHHGHAGPASGDADHHHGLADFQDQCCVFHFLAASLPRATSVVPATAAGVPMALPESAALSGGSGTRLDRPPKSLPLV